MRDWLLSEARTDSTEILHGHGMWQFNTLYPAQVSALTGVAYVQSPRGALSGWALGQGSWVKGPFWHFLQRPALERARGFHATSEDELLDIRRKGFRQPVAVIPNGIDLPELISGGETPSGRTLLYLARLHPGKGVDLLLEAWRLLQGRHPDWRLMIAGADPGQEGYSELLRNKAIQLELERVEFVGGRYGNEKWRTYADSDLYVLPSKSENFGVTVAEALASRIPVIVTEGVPWRAVNERGAGWWIPRTQTDLVQALDKAMSSPESVLHRMGEAGRIWMKEDFSWDRIADRMASFYAWLLSHEDVRPGFVYLD